MCLSLGLSVWPAWWSQAPNWPLGGEIDTFEGVNMATRNQMSLHTEPVSTFLHYIDTVRSLIVTLR